MDREEAAKIENRTTETCVIQRLGLIMLILDTVQSLLVPRSTLYLLRSHLSSKFAGPAGFSALNLLKTPFY
jgi:hypothetical protein